MAPSVVREGTMHCKLDSPLHCAPVRSIFWGDGKSIMEIQARESYILLPPTKCQGKI